MSEYIPVSQKKIPFRQRFHLFLIKYLNVNYQYINPRPSIKFAKEYFKDKPINVVEIGVLEGQHALSILKELNVNKLYLIDPWEPNEDYAKAEPFMTKERLSRHFIECKQRLRKYEDKLVYVRDFSENAVDKIPNDIDFLYIDGNHTEPYVTKDLELYYPKVKNKGLVSGDDVGCEGVTRALWKFCNKINIIPYISDVRDWWFVKKKNGS